MTFRLGADIGGAFTGFALAAAVASRRPPANQTPPGRAAAVPPPNLEPDP